MLLVLTADVDRFVVRRGARGYRYALLDCGMVAERAYLSATARGVGACSVGAFFDPEMHDLLGIAETEEMVLHTVALGSLE